MIPLKCFVCCLFFLINKKISPHPIGDKTTKGFSEWSSLGHTECFENVIKRPARDACLCMGELQAPPAPPAPAAPPAPPAPHFVFLITL